MRPFFLNFLADTLKSCEISLPVGKKTFFFISIIFQVAPPIFDPLNPQKWENVHISATDGPTKFYDHSF